MGFKLASLQRGQPGNATIDGHQNLRIREEGFHFGAQVEGLLHEARERGVDLGVGVGQTRAAATTVVLVRAEIGGDFLATVRERSG